MRSRDGNFTFSLSICAIIFSSFCSSALFADEYLISYRYVIKNAILYNESLLISKAMQKCDGTSHNAIILNSQGKKNIAKIITNNSEEFIDYIHKLGLSVEHQEETANYKNDSTTILTLKTTCFKVDFNDNFARIAPLK
ncbi:hypothetical protein [Sulfurimonas sp.]